MLIGGGIRHVEERSAVRAVSIALFALTFLVGCGERGCLARRLEGQGQAPSGGGEGPPGSPERVTFAAALDGVDCPSGLLRCTGGSLEVSIAAQIGGDCREGSGPRARETASRCACPFVPLGHCEERCVADGVTVAGEPSAAPQLCADGLAAPARTRAPTPLELADVRVCASEEVACRDGLVRLCLTPGAVETIVAACVDGCALGLNVDPGDLDPADGLGAILCRRAHAEQR